MDKVVIVNGIPMKAIEQVDGTYVLPTSITGSLANESHEQLAAIIAGIQTQQSIIFSTKIRKLTVINDGTTDAKFAIGQALVIEKDQSDSTFTFGGSGWSTATLSNPYGGSYSLSKVTDANAVFNPGIAAKTIAALVITGGSAGICNITLSSDGVTWKKPSEIPGVMREDGVTGTNMDSYDCYVTAGTNTYVPLAFWMPNAANWRIKLTVSGTKNALSTDQNLLVDGGWYELPKVPIRIKPGESFVRDIQTDSIYFRAVTGSPLLRIMGES